MLHILEHLPAWAIVASWLVCLTTWLWLIICVDRTKVHRQAVIHAARAGSDYTVARHIVHAVPFDKHLRYVMTFRDWRVLYPAALVRRASLQLYGVA